MPVHHNSGLIHEDAEVWRISALDVERSAPSPKNCIREEGKKIRNSQAILQNPRWHFLVRLIAFPHSQNDVVCNPHISPDDMLLTLTVMIMHRIFPSLSFFPFFFRAHVRRRHPQVPLLKLLSRCKPTMVPDFSPNDELG